MKYCSKKTPPLFGAPADNDFDVGMCRAENEIRFKTKIPAGRLSLSGRCFRILIPIFRYFRNDPERSRPFIGSPQILPSARRRLPFSKRQTDFSSPTRICLSTRCCLRLHHCVRSRARHGTRIPKPKTAYIFYHTFPPFFLLKKSVEKSSCICYYILNKYLKRQIC